MHEFDAISHIPMFLHCGHTFCKKCIEETERKMGALQCSLCRALDFREISLIKKNIIVFQYINPSFKVPIVPCSNHSVLESTFFCLFENIPFCSKCATLHKNHDFYDIDDPVITQGTDVEIVEKTQKAEELLKEAVKERDKVVEVYKELDVKKNENVDRINSVFDELIETVKRKRIDFVQCLNGKYNSSASKIQKVIENCDEVIAKKKRIVEGLFEVKREIGHLAGTARYNTYKEACRMDLDEHQFLPDLEALKKEVGSVRLDIDINTGPILEFISKLSPGGSIREEVLQWKPPQLTIELHPSNPDQVDLIRRVMETGIDISAKVQKVLETTDRKFFMPSECQPYVDSPQRIGYNTSISAPHMHAYTLNWLEKYLIPGSTILDIGCGSGYLTVCLAKMIGKGRVFGIDHIEDIINQAMENISKSYPEIIEGREVRLQMICKDGRNGLSEYAPFDIIHIGAATSEIPRCLLEQLAPGGVILAPLGPMSSFQKITLCEKLTDGTIHYSNLLNVNYAPLTDRERQCPNIV